MRDFILAQKILMNHQFPFEKLEVWQDAKRFIVNIYTATSGFPANEQYGLTSQIKRAVVSVASNLAEGVGRTSYRDQAHFTQLAFSSLMEVACQLVIAFELGFLPSEMYRALRQEVEVLSKKLGALRNSQVKRSAK